MSGQFLPDQAVGPDHLERIALCELALAMDLLPREQKAALFSIAVDERSYGDLARELSRITLFDGPGIMQIDGLPTSASCLL
jgi:hypothetical protein